MRYTRATIGWSEWKIKILGVASPLSYLPVPRPSEVVGETFFTVVAWGGLGSGFYLRDCGGVNRKRGGLEWGGSRLSGGVEISGGVGEFTKCVPS